MGSESKDRCFVITPIGDEGSPIRRHIDGIIDAVIIPVLGEKYEIVVAHKIYSPGSITKQVIKEIYESKLVIANLTDRNPNVMYELALRHAIGKPVIMIAENGTSLPADIITERTIFYRNDAQGVLDLKEKLIETESTIPFGDKSGPVFDALGDISEAEKMIKAVGDINDRSIEPLRHILNRLDNIENRINQYSSKSINYDDTKKNHPCTLQIEFSFTEKPKEYDHFELVNFLNTTFSEANTSDLVKHISVSNIYGKHKDKITLLIETSRPCVTEYLLSHLHEALEAYGFKGVFGIVIQPE